MNTLSSTLSYKRPIVGVFISNNQIRKLNMQSQAFKNSFRYIRFIELAKANQEAQTTLYFFSSKDVKMDKQKILGTYFNETKEHWEKKEYPFPDVLYDRGGGGGRKGKFIRNQLKKKGIKKINPLYSLNKWDVYQKLQQFEEARPYLPMTKVYTKPRDLKIMFRKSREVYIKACKGDSGNGVIRVQKLDEGGYEYCYSRRGKLRIHQVIKRRTLIKKLKIYFQEKNFIVQHAIPLLRIDDRIIDLRAEVQRNGEGKLAITNIAVRIARKGSPITNVQSRPSVHLFENFTSAHPHLFPIEISTLKQRIEKFLFDVYLSMEKSYGTFGEIGIDFGLDPDGTVWFIECNARSAKVAAYLTKDNKMIRHLFLNPLEYATFIYGNGKEKR